MIRKALKYFFPPLTNRQKLPLLPITYNSDNPVVIPPDLQIAVDQLKMAAAVRNNQAALKLLQENPDLTVKQLIAKHKRLRKRSNRWVRAWDRLVVLWNRK